MRNEPIKLIPRRFAAVVTGSNGLVIRRNWTIRPVNGIRTSARFSNQPHAPTFSRRLIASNGFDGDCLAGLQIQRLQNFAHTTGTDHSNHLVAAA